MCGRRAKIDFQPNRLLEVTPYFFDRLCRKLRRSRLDIVTLDEMHERLIEGYSKRRFVCVTFDDGYRDNLQFAYPILKKYQIPFGLYIPTSFPDRLGELWWLALEAVIARNDRIGLVLDGKNQRFDCRTVVEKRAVYALIYAWLRRLPTEEEVRRVIRDLSRRYQVDIAAFCEDLCMSWDELAVLASDPLVTIGAHTVNHVMLKKVPEKAARTEMEMSRSVIAASLGVRPQHLAYPVGDPTSAGPREFQIAQELGFKTAVTTRPGVLLPAAPQSSDGTAAHLGERRVPAHALYAGADVGRRHRGVERLPSRPCNLVHNPTNRCSL